MSDTKETAKKNGTAGSASKKNKDKKGGNAKKGNENAPKEKKMTKAERAALEREQERLAQEKEERAQERRAIFDEMTIFISIAIAILLVLSNFKLSGIAGETVNGALFGLFGWLAYIVPLLIVVLVCFFIANRKSGIRYIFKVIEAFAAFVLMAAIIQIALGETTKVMTPMDYYEYAKANKTGGGLVGGIICQMVVQWFDIVGSYIVLATLEIICLLMISGRAMFKRISESIKESNAERLEKRREMNELYEQYLTSEEAEEYLESRKTGVESMLRGSGNREDVYEGEEDGDEEEYDQSSGLRVKLPVDYPEGTEEDLEEREFEESLKRSHLEKKSDRKEKGGKFNFFGGKTETKPFAAVNEEEKEVSDEFPEEQPANVPATDETADDQENDSIYESELNKKFFGKKEIRETVTTPNRAVSIFKPRAEVKEYITDGDDDLIAPETEKKEMSFSETALRDKEFSYDKEELAKTVDSVPYALSGAANRPLNYKKPVYDEKKDEIAEDEDDDIFGTGTENDNNLTDQYDHESDTENEDYEEPISLLDESPEGNVERPEIGTQIVEEMNNQMAIEPLPKEYAFPPIELLEPPVHRENEDNTDELTETADKLQKTLDSFGVRVTITNVQRGPSVTRYELQPEVGVKVSRITNLADDIKLNLAAADIRIEAPIPGKAAVGIEVPNRENTMVTFRELVESDEFANAKGKIPFTVGKSIDGANIIGDIAKMPHLMIAGATGSGKSVCINTIVMSILYEFKPEDVKLIMIDPKVVELSVYNGIPHLLIPVVTDPKKAASALNWACVEMDERYKKFAELSVRDLKGYNERVKQEAENGYVDENYPILPQMVIIVDELADLMMVASNEVEDSICRLAQKARACGMHLIIATQRPSVNVITGLIKANIPSRIAFAVSSGVDSRTILDNVGAEKLLGKGDMLYYPTGMSKPVRIQGCFVSDKEVNSVVDFITKENSPAVYSEAINEKIARANDEGKSGDARGVAQNDDGRDEYFEEAGRLIIEKEKASIGMLQRAYKIGFNRAARIMDQLAEAGVVSEEDGNKPRQILMTASDYENMLREQQ